MIGLASTSPLDTVVENDLDSLEQEESWVSLQNPHDLCINIITPNIFGSY